MSEYKIEDLTCNITAVNSIIKWLDDFNTTKNKSCLIVMGNHGVGKSFTLDVILNNKGFDIKYITSYNLKELNNARELINKINSQSISMILNNISKKCILIIDKIESINSSTEKLIISDLQKKNDILKKFPIIIISNKQHNKLLNEISKKADTIMFYYPRYAEMRKILIKELRKIKIKVKNEDVINKILEYSQSDITRMLSLINSISHIQVINIEDICNVIEFYKVKDKDKYLRSSAIKLLHNYESISDTLETFEYETVKLPLQMHQQYIKKINKSNFSKGHDKNQLIKDISESLSIGDIIENNIHGEQNYSLRDVYGFFACVYPSYYLSKGKMTNENISKLANEYGKMIDFSKTSIKSSNKHSNFNVAKELLPTFETIDFIYMSNIMSKYFKEGDIDKCVKNILDDNKLTTVKSTHIEAIIKLDKIENTRSSITNKQKKSLSMSLNNSESPSD